MNPQTSSLHAIEALVEQISTRLLRTSEDYRTLHALQNALRELREGHAMTRGTVARSDASPDQKRPPAAERRISLRTAAYMVLKEANKPLSIQDILKALPSHGAQMSARNPRAALSSNLSQDRRFEFVEIDERPCWRLRD